MSNNNKEKIQECTRLRNDTFTLIEKLLLSFKANENVTTFNVKEENIQLLIQYLNTIYKAVKNENHYRKKLNTSSLRPSSSSNKKNPDNLILVSLLHLQYVKSAITLLIHLVVVPLILKGMNVPQFKSRDISKSKNKTVEEFGSKTSLGKEDGKKTKKDHLLEIERENKTNLTIWDGQFIKACQTSLYDNVYKKQNNKSQKEYLWNALEIVWMLLLPLPLDDTSSKVDIYSRRSIFYMSIIDHYPYIIAGTLQLAYKYKNKNMSAYNLINQLFYPETKETINNNNNKNNRINGEIFGESNDNIISDILHNNKLLIPIETNVDIMLTLIAIQRKNTFGETLINQILSHILLNFKNGVEIFATHFLGDLRLKAVDENVNTKNKYLSLLNVVKLLTTVPQHIVKKYEKCKKANISNKIDNDKISFYYNMFYKSINQQIHALYTDLYNKLHKNCIGIQLCIYYFEQFLIHGIIQKKTNISKENFENNRNIPNNAFLHLFFKSISQISKRSNLFTLLGSSNIEVEQEVDILKHYIIETPATFVKTMKYLFMTLYEPILLLYFYTKKRRSLNSFLFEKIEDLLNKFMQKTCICTCYTKMEFVKLSQTIFDMSTDIVVADNDDGENYVSNTMLDLSTNTKDLSRFILSFMWKNNNIPKKDPHFAKMNQLNGHIYIRFMLSSSELHDEIIYFMKLKNEMLWKLAGNHVVKTFEGTGKIQSELNNIKIVDDENEIPVDTSDEKEVNEIDKKIKKLKRKQELIMNMLISIGDEHDGHFGIGNRPNNGNMMVNIMRHSSVLLLECIIIMFQKFVDKIDPIITNEAAKQNTGNYNIHITNSNDNQQQRFIEALNYKYENYQKKRTPIDHSRFLKEKNQNDSMGIDGTENMMSIGINLIEIILHCPNHHEIIEIKKTIRPLILILEHLCNYKDYTHDKIVAQLLNIRLVVLKFITATPEEHESNTRNDIKMHEENKINAMKPSDQDLVDIIEKLNDKKLNEANIVYLLSKLNTYLVHKKSKKTPLIVEIDEEDVEYTITNTMRDSSNGMIISIITIMFGTDESYVYTACIYTL